MAHAIEGTVALVSGANRGIGRALVEALLARGAAKVYAGARAPETLAALAAAHGGRVVPLALDVTDDASVAAAAAAAPDVRLLINNAGVASPATVLAPEALAALRGDIEVNVYGPLRLTQAFAERLADGGAVANLASIASLVNFPMLQVYSVSKAATHSLTQALRAALAPRGVQVSGVYPGPIDTEMARDIPLAKTSPADAARAILDGVESGDEDIFPDGMARQMGAEYFADARGLERRVSGRVAAVTA